MGDYEGGMIALVPSAEDAQRLAVESGLPAEDLHVTLAYLGDEPPTPEVKQAALAQTYPLSLQSPFYADAFAVSVFNPGTDNACIVLGIGGDRVASIAQRVRNAPIPMPAQHEPFAAHMTLRYSDDTDLVGQYTDRTGPILFDRLRVAFGDEVYDMPLKDLTAVTAAVNSDAWHSWPLAPRETKFNADDAIARALEFSQGSAAKFNSFFLYRISDADPKNRESYRLPIADVINGKQVLVPRAVFSAAVIMSGGHGGLEGVVHSEDERREIKQVLTEIYDMLQNEYNDPRVVAPWLLGRTEQEQEEIRKSLEADMSGEEYGAGVWHAYGLVASVNGSGWSGMPLAAQDHPWDGEAARKRVWDWAEGDYRRYRKAFLWWDAERPEQKNSYKLPIADVIDGDLHIVPRAVNAVAAVLGGARGGVDIPDADMDDVSRVVNRIQGRWSDETRDGVEASSAPVYPHSSKFVWDGTDDGMPFTVLADGTAKGLLWMWNRCHAGIMNECVMAPRTATNYAYFHNGQVLTSDGKLVKVGKITMGTGHAGPNMKWIPAADHYDNTGTVAAVGRVTDTPKGGFFNGVVVSSLTDEQVQQLRRSPISGDWRRINNNLELVAALAVNTPGFPIVASINGETQSLVAAGVITDDGEDHNHQDLTAQERDLVAEVDALDEQLTKLAARGRSRKWARLTADLDRRK